MRFRNVTLTVVECKQVIDLVDNQLSQLQDDLRRYELSPAVDTPDYLQPRIVAMQAIQIKMRDAIEAATISIEVE